MRRNRYYHSRRRFSGRRNQGYGYSDRYRERRGIFKRNYGYDDGYHRGRGFWGRDSYGYAQQRGIFRNQSGTDYDDSQEIPTITSSVLGFFTKLSEKGKSVLKKQPPVKVNSYTYDNCQKEGNYFELGCDVESR